MTPLLLKTLKYDLKLNAEIFLTASGLFEDDRQELAFIPLILAK